MLAEWGSTARWALCEVGILVLCASSDAGGQQLGDEEYSALVNEVMSLTALYSSLTAWSHFNLRLDVV